MGRRTFLCVSVSLHAPGGLSRRRRPERPSRQRSTGFASRCTLPAQPKRLEVRSVRQGCIISLVAHSGGSVRASPLTGAGAGVVVTGTVRTGVVDTGDTGTVRTGVATGVAPGVAGTTTAALPARQAGSAPSGQTGWPRSAHGGRAVPSAQAGTAPAVHGVSVPVHSTSAPGAGAGDVVGGATPPVGRVGRSSAAAGTACITSSARAIITARLPDVVVRVLLLMVRLVARVVFMVVRGGKVAARAMFLAPPRPGLVVRCATGQPSSLEEVVQSQVVRVPAMDGTFVRTRSGLRLELLIDLA